MDDMLGAEDEEIKRSRVSQAMLKSEYLNDLTQALLAVTESKKRKFSYAFGVIAANHCKSIMMQEAKRNKRVKKYHTE